MWSEHLCEFATYNSANCSYFNRDTYNSRHGSGVKSHNFVAKIFCVHFISWSTWSGSSSSGWSSWPTFAFISMHVIYNYMYVSTMLTTAQYLHWEQNGEFWVITGLILMYILAYVHTHVHSFVFCCFTETTHYMQGGPSHHRPLVLHWNSGPYKIRERSLWEVFFWCVCFFNSNTVLLDYWI